jgi:hypothetical protein
MTSKHTPLPVRYFGRSEWQRHETCGERLRDFHATEELGTTPSSLSTFIGCCGLKTESSGITNL